MSLMIPDSADSITRERLVHTQAMQLLGEIRDYMARLPPVPMTTDQVKRIDAFMRAPDTLRAGDRAVHERRSVESWSAYAFSAAGLPVFCVEVQGTKLLMAGDALKPLTLQRATVGRPDHIVPAVEWNLRKADKVLIEMLSPGDLKLLQAAERPDGPAQPGE